MPYLTEKNAIIISDAFHKINGINMLEVCYELKVIIIKYDGEVIKDESFIINTINQQELNSTVEKIYNRDISIVEKNYKTTKLISIENKRE